MKDVKRTLGIFSILAAAIGGMIGSGWLFGPFYAAKIAGPGAIIAWAIGGFLMMFIAFTFAELGTMFPKSGSMVHYAEHSHGSFVAFIIAFVLWLSATMVAPIETSALIQYASNYFPILIHRTQSTHILSDIGILVAACIMFSICFLNYFGANVVAKTNIIIVICKLTIPLLTAAVLLHTHFSMSNFSSADGFLPYGIKGVFMALPAAGVIFSFIGYSPALHLAGEAKNPKRTIPIAIIGGIGICILLYTVIQIAFIGALPKNLLPDHWHTFNFTGDAGPFAGIAAIFGIAWLVKILYLDAFISPLGTIHIWTAATSRINYAMSTQGHFPQWMRKLNKFQTPGFALTFNFVIGMIFFLPFPGWQSMVSFLISAFIIAYAIGPVALMVLRHQMPDIQRPFRLPAAGPVCFIALYISSLLVYWSGWNAVSKVMLTLLIAIAYYCIHQKLKKQRFCVNEFKRGAWLIPYLGGLTLTSWLGNFKGGLGLIPFGWDFFALVIFCAISFVLAIKPLKSASTTTAAVRHRTDTRSL